MIVINLSFYQIGNERIFIKKITNKYISAIHVQEVHWSYKYNTFFSFFVVPESSDLPHVCPGCSTGPFPRNFQDCELQTIPRRVPR